MTPLHALLQWVRHPRFIAGVRDMLPASPGIGAWGITTGVALANSGMSLVEVVCWQLAIGSHAVDYFRCATVGDLAHRIVCQPAVRRF